MKILSQIFLGTADSDVSLFQKLILLSLKAIISTETIWCHKQEQVDGLRAFLFAFAA